MLDYLKNEIIRFIDKQRQDVDTLNKDGDIADEDALEVDAWLQKISGFVKSYEVGGIDNEGKIQRRVDKAYPQL